jgi:hypothetical protein
MEVCEFLERVIVGCYPLEDLLLLIYEPSEAMDESLHAFATIAYAFVPEKLQMFLAA